MKAVWTGKITYTEKPCGWRDGLDVEKTFCIYDAYNYETVDHLIRLIKREINSDAHYYPAVRIECFDQATGNLLHAYTFRRGCKVAAELKALLTAVRIDWLENPAVNSEPA